MKIVVLDGYTLNPGDLNWDKLSELGELEVYDRTSPDQTALRCAGADVVLMNKTPLGADVINSLPDLRYIGVLATGYNIVDVAAARQQGIVVTNVPGYGTPSVVQLTFALLLELCHRVQRHSDTVMDGKWARSADFSYSENPLIELSGKTMGIIGYGDIGRQVGEVALAFGMKVIGNSRSRKNGSKHADFRWEDIPQLLELSDVVSLHCPLLPETKGLIDKGNLGRMKSSAFLINTSRGPIIVEQDLADALNSGQIAGAGLDVLSTEPPNADNPLFNAKNCIITPHIAWATKGARERLMDMAVSNLKHFTENQPVNVIN